MYFVNTPLFIWSYVTFYYTCAKTVAGWKIVWYDNCTIILIDSARKRNRKEVLANYNKTRISIVHKHDRWRKPWEFKLMLKYHCACSSETGTCIINLLMMLWDKLHTITTKIHVFGWIVPNDVLYVLKVYINFWPTQKKT